MKNHLIKIHNHADVSSLPLLQAIKNDSELLSFQIDEIESIDGLEIELADQLEAN